jgi:hypothetical protein
VRVTPTTPPRPVDVTKVFPQLAPLARTATRLHPRAGSPSPHDSSTEWDDGTHSWIPYEDQAHATPSTTGPDRNPAMLILAGGYDLQLYACPESPDHPHTDLIQ